MKCLDDFVKKTIIVCRPKPKIINSIPDTRRYFQDLCYVLSQRSDCILMSVACFATLVEIIRHS